MDTEHAGLVALAAFVVFALVGAGIPGRVAGKVEERVCEIAARACAAEAHASAPRPLTEQQRRARDLPPSQFGEPAPGTRQERIATRTPPPPDGDQCSMSPDVAQVPRLAGTRLYDFSYACYGHDICWQNGSYGGVAVDLFSCNRIFLRAMGDHCDRRHEGFGSGAAQALCADAARVYFTAVQAAALKKTRDQCNGDVRYGHERGWPPRITVTCA